MKNTKLYILIMVMISVFLTGCVITRNKTVCPPNKPLFKNYKPRLQGSHRWNYKKYQGPKRKLLK